MKKNTKFRHSRQPRTRRSSKGGRSPLGPRALGDPAWWPRRIFKLDAPARRPTALWSPTRKPEAPLLSACQVRGPEGIP